MSSYLLELVYEGSGFKQVGTAGATLPARSLVYLDTNGQWQLADADSSTTMPVLGITVGAIPSGKTGEVLLWGYIGYSSWSWTAGGDIYASTTAGGLTQTVPAGAGDVVQPVAVAVSSELILFQGSVSGSVGSSNTLEGSTAYVGFDTTKDSFSNYFLCDGTADDVQINAAEAYVTALGGGTVELEAGTFSVIAPIIPTGNEVWFRGQNGATVIDGDGLATGEHIFHITGRNDIHITDMSLQTEDGGGKTCHCIFIEDGSDRFLLERLTFIDCDSDNIHVEGTTIIGGKIVNNQFLDADDNNIVFNMDGGNTADNIHIAVNTLNGSGANNILLTNFSNNQIINNIIESATGDGLELLANCDLNLITDNTISANGAYGINIVDATSLSNTVKDNQLVGNVTGALNDAGTYTQLASVSFFCSEADDEFGETPGKSITTGQKAYVGFHIPTEFQEIVKADMYVIPNATQGAANWDLASSYGGAGEQYNVHTETEAAATYNVTDGQIFEIDVFAAGLLQNLSPDDVGGVSIQVGTAGHDVTLIFMEIYYV